MAFNQFFLPRFKDFFVFIGSPGDPGDPGEVADPGEVGEVDATMGDVGEEDKCSPRDKK